MEQDRILEEIDRRRAELRRLEEQVEPSAAASDWRHEGFYTAYYVLAGMLLGTLGACAALVFNIVGSLLVSQDPLKLIRVYATYLGGERALDAVGGTELALNTLLFLATGAGFGAAIHVVLSRYRPAAPTGRRIVMGSALGLVLWVVNFYGLISWTQPLISGRGLILELIPVWVAALTHLVFGATVALLQPWGVFTPPAARAPGGRAG
jgi:hypothetical protein